MGERSAARRCWLRSARGRDLPAAPTGRGVLVAAGGLACVWGGAVLHRFVHPPPGPVDRAWEASTASTTGPVPRGAAEVLAVVGNGLPATALVVVVGALIGTTRGWLWGATLGASSIVSVLQVDGLKALARRTRPDAAYGLLNAFPSGHTTFAALLGGWVVLSARRPLIRGAAGVWIAAMAWSRTALRAHWLTDVLAAVVVGGAEVVLFIAAAHRLTRSACRRRAG